MYSFVLGFFCLMQGLGNLFYEGSESKYFWLCIPFGLCLNYSPLSLQHQSSHRQYGMSVAVFQ